jgi:hypothetical protein
MKALVVLFTVEHLVMCFPIFILCANIHQRNQYLDTMYGQLSEEQVIIIPLRAKQVSEANLRSKQGGINFTPFVLSLLYAKKNKKN